MDLERQPKTAWLSGLVLILVVVPHAAVIGLGFDGNLILAIVAMCRRDPRMVAVHLFGCAVAILTLTVYPDVLPVHVVGGGGVGDG